MLKNIKKLARFVAFSLGTAIVATSFSTKANNSVALLSLNSDNQVAQFAAPLPPSTSRQVTERSGLPVCSSIPKGWVATNVSSRVCGVGVMTIKNASQEPIGSRLLMCSARSRVPDGWTIVYDGDAKYDTQAICRVVTIEKVSP
jgi:hypothetical protein